MCDISQYAMGYYAQRYFQIHSEYIGVLLGKKKIELYKDHVCHCSTISSEWYYSHFVGEGQGSCEIGIVCAFLTDFALQIWYNIYIKVNHLII